MLTAVIPVRQGSRRVKDKNIAPFGESNLLVHKIRQLKLVPEIDAIYVSSDSDDMLAMAESEGVRTHKRALEYSDEKTRSFSEVVAHIASSVEGDDLMWAQCTSPLIMPENYREAIGAYRSMGNGYDSLMAVEPFKKYIWDDHGPVNFKPGLGHVPSQQLPQMYFTTGLRIAPREKMVEWHYFVGPNPYKFPLPKICCIDIDDQLGLDIARSLYEQVRAART